MTSTVFLNGSGSSDVDGDALTYSWSWISRPAGSTAALSDPAVVNPTFVTDRPGTYVAQLIVNDGTVDSTPDTVTIVTLNSPPVANAGPGQSVPAMSTVFLNGSGSSDVDGDALTYSWSLIGHPMGSTATLSDSTVVNPTFVADQPGTYVAQLIVNDGTVDSAPDTVTITTLNAPPVANAGPDQAVAVASTVFLDGRTSSDVDGDALTYSWSWISRPAGSTAALSNPAAVNPTFVADRPGTYVAQLIVNDGTVDSVPDTVTIVTLNSPPVANAGPDQSAFVTFGVSLDGGASSERRRRLADVQLVADPPPGGKHGDALQPARGESDVCGGPAWDVRGPAHRQRWYYRYSAGHGDHYHAERAAGSERRSGSGGARDVHGFPERQRVERRGRRRPDVPLVVGLPPGGKYGDALQRARGESDVRGGPARDVFGPAHRQRWHGR